MTVKDLTYTNRVKAFEFFTFCTFIGLTIRKLWLVDFDYKMIEFGIEDFFQISLPGILSAVYIEKIKLKVIGITELDKLLDWITNYFKTNSGQIIFEEGDYMVFQVTEEKKRLFRTKTEYSYYEIKIGDHNALIEGPVYRKPKRVKMNE